MRSALALLTLAAVSVSAQVANYTSELDMKVDPNTVDPSTRRKSSLSLTGTGETAHIDNDFFRTLVPCSVRHLQDPLRDQLRRQRLW